MTLVLAGYKIAGSYVLPVPVNVEVRHVLAAGAGVPGPGDGAAQLGDRHRGHLGATEEQSYHYRASAVHWLT